MTKPETFIDTSSIAGCGAVDWQAYAAAGYRRAAVRACVGTGEDARFASYWTGMDAAGLARIAYLFWRAKVDPELQARRFIEIVGDLKTGDLAAFDLEFPGGRVKTGLTAQQALDRALACYRVLATYYGEDSIRVYTSARVVKEDLGNRDLGDLLRSACWLAYYVPSKPGPPLPPGWDRAWAWQFRGNVDARTIPGFKRGLVDLNRLMD